MHSAEKGRSLNLFKFGSTAYNNFWLSILPDRSKVFEIQCGKAVYSVSCCFTADSEQVLSGGADGMLRRWQVDDGHQVGSAIPVGCAIYATALSKDCKWLVCGLPSQPYARMWNAETDTKVLDIADHTNAVLSVDISSDSTIFATGGLDNCAFIWSITTGKRLVGPLRHDSTVDAVRFSPDAHRLATAATGKSIRIFNSDNGQQLLNIPCSFVQGVSSPLAWSANGGQIFAASQPSNEAKCFDTSLGSLLSSWPFPTSGSSVHRSSIAASANQKFIAITRNTSLSFHDASTNKQIGPVINHASEVYFMTLSPGDAYVVTGEANGKVTMRGLCGVLPDSYLTGDRQFPLMQISEEILEVWTEGDLTRTEQVLSKKILESKDTSGHSQHLAHRSLVRSRLKQYTLAIDDAVKSVEVQWSTIGQIAITIARAANGDYDAALRIFDLVFTNGSLPESNFVLLIKAIVLFRCGRHDEAVSRVDDLINAMKDKDLYSTIRARMCIILTCMSLEEGDHQQAAEWLRRAGEPVVPEDCPELVVISLIFGWNFDGLGIEIQQHLEQCMNMLEDIGDIAMQSGNADEAIERYSAALSLNPSNPASLLVKRSNVRATIMSWEDALKDADDAIEADPQGPWGYERRHAALHALERYDDAADTIKRLTALNRHCGAVGTDVALRQLFEELMTHSGEATVLAWEGKSSSYNSCLPASLTFHPRIPEASLAMEDVEMDKRISELKSSMSPTEAMLVYDRVKRLPLARFAHWTLCLPCILFPVRKLTETLDSKIGEINCFRARVSGIGHVEFRTSDTLSLAEPRKLVFAHPWIRDLRGPLDDVGLGSPLDSSGESESWSGSEVETNSQSQAVPTAATPPLYGGPIATMDDYTRALQLVVRLQQPFQALLLQQQSHGKYKRVAAEHEIVLPGLERRISCAKEIRVGIVQIS